MTNFVTVVYAIEDNERFLETLNNYIAQQNAYMAGGIHERPDVGVCAVSSEHEISRLEKIDAAVNDNKGIVGLADALVQALDLPKPLTESTTLPLPTV